MVALLRGAASPVAVSSQSLDDLEASLRLAGRCSSGKKRVAFTIVTSFHDTDRCPRRFRRGQIDERR